MYDYLIIGNGIAGLSAAEEIRKQKEDATILIISDEKAHTYWRTRLSDLICHDFNADDILVKKEPWYNDKKVSEKLGEKVFKIDRERKVVILENGEEIAYGKVLIATGSHAFLPPIKNIDAQGVFAIRSADDLICFKEYVKDKKRLVIIGGGILGLEAANSAHELGLEVVVIESFDYLLSRQLDKDLSVRLEKSLNEMGIKTLTGKATSEILVEDGSVIGVKLSDGSTIDTQAVMIQAGVRANIKLAQNSDLKTEKGVIVDSSLITEDENIYAAGDVAQIGNFTIGLWTASQEMGKIAGANMTGEHRSYQQPKPFSTLILGDLKLFSAGVNTGDGIEEISKEIDGKIYKLFKNKDKYVGGILWADIKYQMDVKKIVFDGVDPSETKLGSEIFGL